MELLLIFSGKEKFSINFFASLMDWLKNIFENKLVKDLLIVILLSITLFILGFDSGSKLILSILQLDGSTIFYVCFDDVSANK